MLAGIVFLLPLAFVVPHLPKPVVPGNPGPLVQGTLFMVMMPLLVGDDARPTPATV